MNAPLRQFASPYARKLAGERGIALVDLTGSGPSGRIVAADVLSFVQPPVVAAQPAPSPAAAAVETAASTISVAAIATQIDLGRLQDLLAQFSTAQLPLSLDVFLLRAAGRSLEALGLKGEIGWETGKSESVVAGASQLALGVLQSRLNASETTPAETPASALLSVRRISQSGIRAVSMPLLPGHKMRLLLSVNSVDASDCLLCFDVGIGEDEAITFLSTFKDGLEAPFGLLA